jgi:alkaline phosphatase
MRIVAIADIHLGPDRHSVRGSASVRALDGFVQAVESEIRPDLVVDLGDRVVDVDPDADRERQHQIASVFAGISCPVLHVMGNHDAVNLARADNEQIFGQPMRCHSIDVGGFHFVVLDTCDPVLGGVGGAVSREQLQWLDADLSAASAASVSSVILCHHALCYHDISRNVLFKGIEPWAFASNREEIWQVVSSHPGVVLVLHGHLHWTTVERVGDVPCLSANSPVESWTTGGEVRGEYAVVTLSPGEGGLDVDFQVRRVFPPE